MNWCVYGIALYALTGCSMGRRCSQYRQIGLGRSFYAILKKVGYKTYFIYLIAITGNIVLPTTRGTE
jgi:hypothetical protein